MCKLCETNPVYEFTNKRKICKNCFVRYFQKKFLTTIRKFEMIRKGDIIGYNTQGCTTKNIQKNIFTKGRTNFRDVVLEDLLNMFGEKGFVEIVRYQMSDIRCQISDSKLAISSTIDSESDKIVHMFVEGNVKDLKKVAPVDKKIIKPLYLFLDEEVLLYAKIKKLKFKEKKIKKDKLSMFVDDLEKKHPEIKRAILNTYLELE